MKNQQGTTVHYLIVMVATLLWGVNIVSLKVLVSSFAPVTMTAFRIFTAGLVLTFGLLLWKQGKKMSKSEWIYVSLGGVLGVFAHHLFLAIGLTTINASTAVLLLGLVPVATALYSVLFLKERFTTWKIVGMGLAFIGVLFVQGGITQIGKGSIFLLIAVLVQALSFLFIRKASETMQALQVTTISLLFGAMLLFLFSLYIEPQGIRTMMSGNLTIYSIFLFSAIASTAAGQFLFNLSISRIGPSKSALFLNFVPFFGVLSSALLLNEMIRWYQWCGFVFIVLGVLFGTGYVERSIIKSVKRTKKMA
ncbi:DMT family transporter [Alkalicoccobacillus plakortidis]|uniref:DMT family transporter n=1 Tax=Alkalicoccobacillus plakortidis TaxID=444060 RepID=A0ABT0XGQ2_9BACI|nr:DMT family transporter [Alkalicoccobacillus plakortidis]MCM2674399.1 DMT family transporter [Alkalicoccobacillus plakortidis]